MTLEQAINHLEEELKNKQDWSCVACKEEHEQLLEWLKELQAIKSAELSEALDKFDYIGNDIKFAYDDDYVSYDYTDDVEYIKNTLIKAQEQEKVFEIIFEKNVDIIAIKESKTLEEYNRNAWEVEHYGRYKGYRLQLTEEEFNLLKEWSR